MTSRFTQIVHSLGTITGELRHNGKGWILLSVASGWSLSIGVRYIYPSLLPFFRVDFEFGLTTAGMLLSALWFAYAIGQFPGGFFGDRIGEGNILVISTAISAGAIVVVATSVSVWSLFVGTVLFGLATALYGPTRYTIFTDIYANRAGTAVGLSHAAGSIGNTILPAVAAAIATYSTWRLGFGILLPAFVGVTLALWLVVPDRTSTSRQSTNIGNKRFIYRIFKSIAQDGIPVVVIIQILIGFVSQGVLGFYPTYLVSIKGFTPQEAAFLFGFYFAIGILVQPFTGLSKDRFGSRATLAFLIGMFFAGLITLHFANATAHIIIVTAFLSHRNGIGIVTNTFVADGLFDDIKGTGLGVLRTTWILLGAVSPVLVGYFGDLGLLRLSFLLLAFLAGIALLLTIFVPRGDLKSR